MAFLQARLQVVRQGKARLAINEFGHLTECLAQIRTPLTATLPSAVPNPPLLPPS